MWLSQEIKQIARKFGIDVRRYNVRQSEHARLFHQLSHFRVDVVLDVGANDGGYASSIRKGGCKSDILSFEPLLEAHELLSKKASKDQKWHVAPRMALGRDNGQVSINVSANSKSSSVLAMETQHLLAEPKSRYVGVQEVPLRRLDAVSHPTLDRSDAMFLKVDTQGYEMEVLEGATGLIERICGVQLELSLTQLYGQQASYQDVIHWMGQRGFSLWNVIPGFVDPSSGRLLQLDGIFFRD